MKSCWCIFAFHKCQHCKKWICEKHGVYHKHLYGRNKSGWICFNCEERHFGYDGPDC
jgi:hypothetical protein